MQIIRTSVRLSKKKVLAWKSQFKTANKHEFNVKVNLCQAGRLISFATRYSKIRKIPFENKYTPSEYTIRLVAGE